MSKRKADDRRGDPLALDRQIGGVEEFGALTRQHRVIALFEIGELIGQRRERHRVRAEIDFAFAFARAEADGKRRALARTNQKIVFALEKERERKSAFQPRQAFGNSLDWRKALRQSLADKMRDDFGIGLGFEGMAFGASIPRARRGNSR